MQGRILNTLLDDVDDWFNDLILVSPISQFQLEADRKDRTKLATINRTTSNWFKLFKSIEPLTDDGLSMEDLGIDGQESDSDEQDEDGDAIKSRVKVKRALINVVAKSIKRAKNAPRRPVTKSNNGISQEAADESHLDSLAKDLELLLDEKVVEEPKYYYHVIYPSDDISLSSDSTLGYCQTVDTTPTVTSMQQSHAKRRTFRGDIGSYKQSYTQVTMNTRARTSSMATRSSHKGDKVTPAPTLDHEYIGSQPLPTDRLTQVVIIKGKLQNAYQRKPARSKEERDTTSVLNTGAIKRFARFSDKFRVLSEKQESIKFEAFVGQPLLASLSQ